MDTLGSMVDLKQTPEESQEYAFPSKDTAPAYPYGLCISLNEDVLDKIGMSYEDFTVNDLIHLHAFGVVTSVSCNETQDKKCCRIEIQITHLNGLEDESTEDEDDEEQEDKKDYLSKLYK